jgi:hypothetical protein
MARELGGGVRITGLNEFRAALKAADAKAPRALSTALRRAGQPVLRRVQAIAPVGRRSDDPHPGLLQRSYGVQVRGTRAGIVSSAPYGAGAEWGMHGKWAGFRDRYRPAPGETGGRFAFRALLEVEDEVAELVTEGLEEVITIQGWAREGTA